MSRHESEGITRPRGRVSAAARSASHQRTRGAKMRQAHLAPGALRKEGKEDHTSSGAGVHIQLGTVAVPRSSTMPGRTGEPHSVTPTASHRRMKAVCCLRQEIVRGRFRWTTC